MGFVVSGFLGKSNHVGLEIEGSKIIGAFNDLDDVLEKNNFPMYKSENNKLYKKQNGAYRRIKDIYGELLDD